VWREWIEDSAETEVLVYANDLTSGLYQPYNIVKDKEALD
jgi:hypothetical protein